MGVYDFVLIEPNVEMPSYEISTEHSKIAWQTRAFSDPMYRLHCISEDGFLYRANHNYDSSGFAESYGETGSFEFLESLDSDDYGGYPIEYSEFDWHRIRYVGNMRITAQQTETESLLMYDIDFDRHSISSIERIPDDGRLLKGIRSKMGNVSTDDLDMGQTVFDREYSKYEVLEIINQEASNYVAKPKVVDRGHVIHQERTVADMNPSYPEDDKVVKVEPKDGGPKRYFPISRIALKPSDAF